MALRKKEKIYDRPSGPMVEFYLPPNEQYKKGHLLPWSINGYTGHAVVGSKNTAPKDVVEMLKNCKSQSVVASLKDTDPAQRGVPRAESDFYNPVTEHIYQSDFDIEVLKEGVA